MGEPNREPEAGDSPLVSVVIPCFRHAHYLPGAIESCLDQTYSHLQVIVVNDGSDDDTEAVARRYGDRIDYVYRDNGGLPAARNTGLSHAQGAYVKFLDADDQLHPETLARQVRALAGAMTAVCCSRTRVYKEDFPDQYEDEHPPTEALLPGLLRDVDWGGLQAFLLPVSMARKVGGFDESLKAVEDWDFLCRLGLDAPPLVFDPHPGAYYRVRTDSMARNAPRMALALAASVVKLHDLIRDTGRADWFGVDLLGCEQRAYTRMLRCGVEERQFKTNLQRRMRELERLVGIGPVPGRFRYLVRMLGYPRAEAVRTLVSRFSGKR